MSVATKGTNVKVLDLGLWLCVLMIVLNSFGGCWMIQGVNPELLRKHRFPNFRRNEADYILIYKTIESLLSPNINVPPDVYIETNGHINCSSDWNIPTTTITIQSPPQIPAVYAMKHIAVDDYRGCDVSPENVADYLHPKHLNLVNDHPCPPIDVCIAFGDGHITDANNLPLRNQSCATQPGIDDRSSITNGDVRIPPDGMEAISTVGPQ